MEAVVRDGKVALFTRNGHDAEAYFPRLLTPPTWIEAREAIVDGEVVALDGAGRPDFGLLQERISLGRTGRPVPLVYQAFDLLYLDGRSLLDVPLEQRKRLLELVVRPTARVQVRPHIETEGIAFFEAAKAQALEGIVAKHRRSRYEPGRRASTWLKIKARPEQELVVGGWTPGEGTAKELGALVVGVYDGERLRFAGKVGSGFDGRTRKELRARLESLETDAPAVRPRAAAGLQGPLGRRPRGRALGPAGARDPGGDRRLDPGRARAPDRLQGHRARSGPARGAPRAGSRPGEGRARCRGDPRGADGRRARDDAIPVSGARGRPTPTPPGSSPTRSWTRWPASGPRARGTSRARTCGSRTSTRSCFRRVTAWTRNP